MLPESFMDPAIREVYLADLSLRGWCPVRAPAGEGIWNASTHIGWMLRQVATNDDPLGMYIGQVTRLHGGGFATLEWGDLSDKVLAKLVLADEETGL